MKIVRFPSFGIFRLETSAGLRQPAGIFAWELVFKLVIFESFEWRLSLGIFRLGTFGWDRPLWKFRLQAVALDLSLGIFA